MVWITNQESVTHAWPRLGSLLTRLWQTALGQVSRSSSASCLYTESPGMWRLWLGALVGASLSLRTEVFSFGWGEGCRATMERVSYISAPHPQWRAADRCELLACWGTEQSTVVGQRGRGHISYRATRVGDKRVFL